MLSRYEIKIIEIKIQNPMDVKTENYEWDAFISHASEDKEEVVLPLYEILSKKGMKVWVDKHEIFLGDSLRRKLDEGLAKSRFGIVVLSERFFQKEWTKKELDALVSREDGKEKVIFPIWHKIDKPSITKYSPLLSDKIATPTESGLETVAEDILRAFKKELDKKGILFSNLELNSLKETIRYTRSREGNFYSTDPLVQIVGKLNSEEGVNMKNYNPTELSVLLKAVDENIKYLNAYKYEGLSEEAASNNKQRILVPLYGLKTKIMKEI